MNASELEAHIESAIAKMAHAQQKIIPILDLCWPRMLDEAARQEFRDKNMDLYLAMSSLKLAVLAMENASKMIANITSKENQ